MRTNFKILWLFSLVALSFLASCKKDDPINVVTGVKIVNNTEFGNIITDSNGQSLYFFTKDVSGNASCVDGCLNIWPVFYVENLQVGTGLDANDFAQIQRSDQKMQTTYRGWPLYYYSSTGDGNFEPAGEAGGDGINNVWFVAKESYNLMVADEQLVGHDGKNYTSDYQEGTGTTKYFTDALGRTIYSFSKDVRNTNNFTASDLSNNGVWPVFYTQIDNLPSFMDKNDFGQITVYGETQLTYKGWPLYYFGQDSIRGHNKGISFPSPGVWPIVNNTTTEAPQ